MNFLTRFIAEDMGVTTVEYCLIAALVGVALTGAIGLAAPDIFSVLKTAAEATPVD